MDRVIQLVVNDEIQAVKKLKTSEASPLDVLLFLASVEATMERLADIYVEKAGLAAEGDAAGVEEVSKKASRMASAALKGLELDKKEREALKLFLKAYYARKLLKKLGIDVYYGAAVQSLRKGLKKK